MGAPEPPQPPPPMPPEDADNDNDMDTNAAPPVPPSASAVQVPAARVPPAAPVAAYPLVHGHKMQAKGSVAQ